MRHLDSQWQMSIGWCLFVFVQANSRVSSNFFSEEMM